MFLNLAKHDEIMSNKRAMMALNRSPGWTLNEISEIDRICFSNLWSRRNSASNVDNDQGHPQTKCIFAKYYSNLANGFVEEDI